MPLAQLNLARMRFPIDSPEMESFLIRIAPLNEAAEEADGFIWRLKDADSPGSTGYRLPDDDELLVNLSVWLDLEALRAFVIGHLGHRAALGDRSHWFERADQPMTVCWHVADGHVPTLQEAASMLDRLRREGSTEEVFAFSHRG